MATRAAIEGGAAPAKAYKLSDLYINKIDQCKRMTEIFEYRKRSLYDFAKLVVEEREKEQTQGIRSSVRNIYENIIIRKFVYRILRRRWESVKAIYPGYLKRNGREYSEI